MMGILGSEAELSRDDGRSGTRSGAVSINLGGQLMTSRGSRGDDGGLKVEVLANVGGK